MSWTAKALWQTTEGPLQGAALLQSSEGKKKKKKELSQSFEEKKMN